MATITEKSTTDGKTRYQVRIRRKGYPPISKYFDKKIDAETYAILTEAKLLKNEEYNPQETRRWTIPEVFEWYKKNPDPQRKLETKKHYQRIDFLGREFANFTVATLTPKILSKWIQRRLEINKPATVYHYYVALKNALVYHSIQSDYSQNIFELVKCPTKPGERDRRFSDDEIRTLFKSIKVRSKIKKKEMMLAVLLLVNLASRVGETLQLQWKNVNLEKRYIDFLAHTTKTKVFRRVPLSTKIVKILKWFKKHHNPENDPNKRVLCMYGVNEHHLSRQFQICCDRAGIEDIRIHDLRHEAVSRLVSYVNPKTGETLNLMEVMAITGHKSLSSLKRYTHLQPSTILQKLV